MRNNRGLIISAIVLVVVILFFLFQWQSLSIAMKREGALVSVMSTQFEFESNGLKHRVMISTTKDGEDFIALAQRNKLGFWKILQYSHTRRNAGNAVASIIWIDNHCFQSFQPTDIGSALQRDSSTEHHYVYHGTTAKALIEFPPEQIPDNMTVGITQAQGYYVIHVISYEANLRFNVEQLLVDTGVIDG